MSRNSKDWFLLFTIISCCSTKPIETEKKVLTEVKEVVLVNVSKVDRCQIGQLINLISECSPKIIGINLMFVEEKEKFCDSVLSKSIVDSDKVVLIEGFENGNHVRSNNKFFNVSFLSGLTGLSQSEDGITDYYYRLTDLNGKWALSFPFLIALQYDKYRTAELASKVTPKDYPIVFSHALDDFSIVNYSDSVSMDCHLLSEKIVLIGDLNSNNNVFRTRVTKNSTNKTYGTVIIANVILDILKDLE